MRDIGKILIRTHFDRFPRDQLAIRDVMVGEASVRCLARPKRRGRARAKKCYMLTGERAFKAADTNMSQAKSCQTENDLIRPP